MSSVFMHLDSVMNEEIYSRVVRPLLESLAGNGIPASGTPTKDEVISNEGVLTFGLTGGGELTIVFTTGPHPDLMGEMDDSRYLMAVVSKIPRGSSPNERDVLQAFSDFRVRLYEDEVFEIIRVTENDSFRD